MKKIGKIKLIQLSKTDLQSRQMNALKGGATCACAGCLCNGGVAAANNQEADQPDLETSSVNSY